jgi:hypothetical protein
MKPFSQRRLVLSWLETLAALGWLSFLIGGFFIFGGVPRWSGLLYTGFVVLFAIYSVIGTVTPMRQRKAPTGANIL